VGTFAYFYAPFHVSNCSEGRQRHATEKRHAEERRQAEEKRHAEEQMMEGKTESRVMGGYKATLKNPRVSPEAKEHAEEVLEQHHVPH